MIYFTAHTFKCVCHCIKAMFRVLGVYNFGGRGKILFMKLMYNEKECVKMSQNIRRKNL